MRIPIVLLISVFLVQGCATRDLWKGYQEKKYLEVESSEKDVEQELKLSGLDYYCEKLVYSTENRDKKCYVEMNFEQKSNEFIKRLYETPRAVAVDSAKTIYVVGRVTFEVFVLLCNSSINGCHN